MKIRNTIMWMLLVVFWADAAVAAKSNDKTAATVAARLQDTTIKRYWFSVGSAAELKSAFARRQVQLTGPLTLPAEGQTMQLDGVGPSGIGSHFVIEQKAGQFHLYAERRRPQHPVAPLPYLTQDVVFDTANPEVSPVGTFSYPSQGGPFPAVVLVAGTGAHNRDGNVSLHKTLLVLADHLTRQGFAVLRYDKRGVGLTGGAAHPASTTEDYAADALGAVRFLKMQPQVKSDQIGVLGHSEGGLIAAMAAAQAPAEVNFIVLLAAPGLKGLELKTGQDAAARRADGMPEHLVLANQQQERQLYEIAASSLSHQEAITAMQAATAALPQATKTLLDIPPEGIPDWAYESLLTPWFRRFLQLDPAHYLSQVQCPVLVLQGAKDVQVPATENLQRIREALGKAAGSKTAGAKAVDATVAGEKTAIAQGGNPQVKVLLLPELNHLLQQARTGAVHEYLLIEQTIAPVALGHISSWMQQLTKARPATN
ncbi:alpha/beta hydrolase family protein [Rheinheimera sp. 4Y26]|uniref:alpha/beta hydrolase family protein n=1 Tax=Rheinheimera sp. 4Y26 TaxID=2977811 RepID=UPI0021B09315|nr:alpha/beta fold hydrolase [Rheinheimera sp. 4Y26]MCT6699805.1 alpha/beta fold hydrolase [Rheinheimera sp. 4Y26]